MAAFCWSIQQKSRTQKRWEKRSAFLVRIQAQWNLEQTNPQVIHPSEPINPSPQKFQESTPKIALSNQPAETNGASGRSTLQKSGLSMRQLPKLPVEVGASTSMTSESRRTKALARLRSSTWRDQRAMFLTMTSEWGDFFMYIMKKMKVLGSIVTWAAYKSTPKIFIEKHRHCLIC